MKRFVFLLFAPIMLVALSACSEAKVQVNSTDQKLNLAQQATTQKAQDGDSGPDSIDVAKTIISPSNMFLPSENIVVGPWTFSNVSTASISNKLSPTVSPSDVVYFNEQSGREGTLTDGSKYLSLDISIQNTAQEKAEYNIGSCRFVFLNAAREIVDNSNELRYLAPNSHGAKSKYRYNIEFQPGETKRLTLLYILQPRQLDTKSWYFLVDSAEHGDGYENYKVYKVTAQNEN